MDGISISTIEKGLGSLSLQILALTEQLAKAQAENSALEEQLQQVILDQTTTKA